MRDEVQGRYVGGEGWWPWLGEEVKGMVVGLVGGEVAMGKKGFMGVNRY